MDFTSTDLSTSNFFNTNLNSSYLALSPKSPSKAQVVFNNTQAAMQSAEGCKQLSEIQSVDLYKKSIDIPPEIAAAIESAGLTLKTSPQYFCNLGEALNRKLRQKLPPQKLETLKELNYSPKEWLDCISTACEELKLLHQKNIILGKLTLNSLSLELNQAEHTLESHLQNFEDVKIGFGFLKRKLFFEDPLRVFGIVTPLSDIFDLAIILSSIFDDPESPKLTKEILKEDCDRIIHSLIQGIPIEPNPSSLEERYPFEEQIKLICGELMCVILELLIEVYKDPKTYQKQNMDLTSFHQFVDAAAEYYLAKNNPHEALHSKILEITSSIELAMRHRNIRVANIDELLAVAKNRLGYSGTLYDSLNGMTKNFSSISGTPASTLGTAKSNAEVIAITQELGRQACTERPIALDRYFILSQQVNNDFL